MSVMDMNSRMAMAEKLSVQQLQQAVQSGSLPAYIGIPLIEQKTKEKAQMAAAQGGQQKPPSVASQILQQAEQQQGIDQLPSNLPVMDGAEMGMANGGIVAFADEGQVVDPYAAPTPIAPGMLPPAISPEGKAAFEEYAAELKALRGKGGSEREQAKNMAIFQAGLGIMGGTSPNAFANIAQGVQPAVAQYQQQLQSIKKDDRDNLKQLLDLGVSKEKFLQEAQKMGIDVYKANKIYDAQIYSADAQIRAAGVRANAEKQPRSRTPTDLADEFIATQTQDYISQGVEPAKAKLLAQKDYYAQSRPMQPSAGIAPAVINAQEKDEVLQALGVQLMRARNDPEKQKDIQEKIDARKAVIAGQVSGYGTSGRGVGGTGGATGGTTPPPAPAPARQPLPMPKSAADAVVGEIYNTARGPAKWDGKQFVLVP